MPRTLAQAQTMRDAVYTAWLKALTAEGYSESSAGGGVSVNRPDCNELKKQLDDLDDEIASIGRGGIRVVAITPIG